MPQWVTLHVSLQTGDRQVLGLLDPEQSGPQGYLLTRYVTKEETFEDGYQGVRTTVHTGVWIVNTNAVWMVEYEPEAPLDGFERY